MENLLNDIFGTAKEISPGIFALRTIVVGVMLYIEGRVLPHRSGGPLAGYDFVFFWMMGGLTAAPLFEAKISILNTVVVVTVIYLLHYLISYLAVTNRTFARLVMGQAVPIISGGKILRHNLARNYLPLELLLSDLRTVDAPNLSEVEFAVLETNGHISVLKKSDYQPVTPKDLNIATGRSGLPAILVNDGKVIIENLAQLGYDEKWLKNELMKKGITDIQEMYVATLDSAGELYYSVKNQG